jgi:hypothetical protein
MMLLIEPEPEEKQDVADAFAEIHKVPRWQMWMEAAIRLAAILTILDFLYRLWPI